MKFPHTFENIAALALVAFSFMATRTATAQTVISNETLMSTTLVVNKTPATADCTNTGCYATKPMFAPVSVTCPAATGKTCTLHISLDARIALFSSVTSFYQFLVDGATPTIGPTGKHGGYIFAQNVAAQGEWLVPLQWWQP
jgi:hypothetical protein